MAQWLGQFTGNSHQTKVEDLEATLRHAIDIFRETALPEERLVKEKAVRKLAKKLLTARLKFLRAKLYDAEPVTENIAKKQKINIESLRHQEIKTRLDGINGILVEFGAQDLAVQG